MNNGFQFDADEVIKAVDLIADGIFEVRLIHGKQIFSGYFNDGEKLVNVLSRFDLKGTNVYITLQKIHPGCEARVQWEQFLETGRLKVPTTSDSDVIGYRWLPIDLDPVRPTGISSTNEELREAEELKYQIATYMEAQGFDRYISGFSGNGYHLLYSIEGRHYTSEQVKAFLQRLDSLFSNDACKVDTTLYNPSRICKLYGTVAQKGRHTKSRPFRLSKILEVNL